MQPDLQVPELPKICVVEPFSQFSQKTVHRRWHAFNICARLILLTGFEFTREEGLGFLCDLARQVVHYARGMIYFWDNEQPPIYPLLLHNMETPKSEALAIAGRLNFWTRWCRRPLLIARGLQDSLDLLLDGIGASLLVIPLFAKPA